MPAKRGPDTTRPFTGYEEEVDIHSPHKGGVAGSSPAIATNLCGV